MTTAAETLPGQGQAPRPTFPRWAIIAAGLVLGATILGAAIGVRTGPVPVVPEGGTVLASRDLQFRDRPDGSVLVSDARSGARVEMLEPGTSSFIRATLRALVRERRMGEFGTEAAFRLTALDNGRLTLEDLATGRTIDLVAFGPTQVESFARLLNARSATP